MYSQTSQRIVAITEVNNPNFLITITNDLVAYDLNLSNFQGYTFDTMSFLLINNVKDVTISNFVCGNDDTSDTHEGRCFFSTTSLATGMGTLSISAGKI